MRKRTGETAADSADNEFSGDRQFVTALHRGLEILRAFRPSDLHGLGNRELAERTGLPNSTVSRLSYTLLKLGYLAYDDGTGRYTMGVPVLSLGYACLGGMKIRETAQPFMQKLADDCGDGVLVALGGRDDNAMTYIACARAAKGMISLQLNVGSRISLARSAMGRAYIAGTSEAERNQIMEQIEDRYGPDEWPQIRDEIFNAQEQIRDQGFYVSLGKWQSDVHAVSVPYRSMHGDTPMLAYNLGGPGYILPRERLVQELGPRLVEMKDNIARTGV
ncbi:Pca regulon regulatory protein [Thalassovita gelatinovora]|uniref:Pca regulon regulatory protein n=1 Tax=Thalassovita gelatinovora TaxID=53501 RepID=A0A0P1FWC7_THAGE|nr:IclR family transcriptional regulator [Thalassovita gelatinovora]QIZ80753.1 IclR family transcriptional regulator [Thalassovita gelatinovora]CUH65396.1 Pca regulon regulatory protein [Thalassovita gelatinovora]SEQ90463.1 transcriptional regulator, IclR family [Thalassovita gelatinovora]